MNTANHKLAATVLALAAVLSACAPVAPRWESSFGDAVRGSVASQVANPAAARNPNPVAGIDGRAAQAAQQHYEKSFSAPTAPEPAMVAGSSK